MGLVGQCYYSAAATRVGQTMGRRALGWLRALGVLKHFRLPLDALSLNHASCRELMRLWSNIHWADAGGMMPAEQLLAVYRLAATWPVAGDVVELGSWRGSTTSYLATACRAFGEGTVYAVDTFRGTKEGQTTYAALSRHGGETLTDFTDQITRAGVTDGIRPLVGLTTETARSYPGRRIRVVLVDADHSFDGVRADFEAWLPHMAVGGLIIFHDYLMPEVARFIDSVVRRHPAIDSAPGLVAENVFAVTKKCEAVASHELGSQCSPKTADRTIHRPMDADPCEVLAREYQVD